MSSIERDESARRALEAFFDTTVLPLSARLREQGTTLMPLGPDPSRASYYVTRHRPSMTREDFESPSCASFDDLAQRLEAQWRSHGREDLAALAPALGALAREAYALDDESADVSPFVYVMF